VPWRNAHEPTNGMRGYGLVVRIDLNDFNPSGVEFLDMTTAIRNQIPSYPDVDLRGFSAGFPCFLLLFLSFTSVDLLSSFF